MPTKLKHDLIIIVTRPREVVCYQYDGLLAPVYSYTFKRKTSLSKCFMKGVLNTQSKYIVRIDGDDYDFTRGMPFGIGVEILDKYPNICAVYPTYKIFNIDKCGLLNHLAWCPYPQGGGIIYNREAFIGCGGYDTRIDHQADLDFYIRFRGENKTLHYPAIYYWYCSGKNRSLNKNLMLKRRKEVLRNHFEDDTVIMDDFIPHFGLYAYI